MSEDGTAERATHRWVQGAVIDLGLCPFAAGPWGSGKVRVTACHSVSFEEAVRAAAEEIQRLVEAKPEVLSSTLLVMTRALGDFEEFLDAIEAVDDLIVEAGAQSLVQLAHFHPDYRFEGTEASDLGNYTNRSPAPTFHLLRPHEVEQALESYGDGLAIPEANIRTLRGMGRGPVSALWESFRAEAPKEEGPDPAVVD